MSQAGVTQLPIVSPIPRRDLQTEVTTRLLELIASQPAGSRLPSERELGEMIGVSRNTLREALRSLAFLGAIQIKQGQGIRVSHVDDQAVDRLFGLGLMIHRSTVNEVIEARIALEVDSAAMAAKKHNGLDKTKLLDVMTEMAANENNVPEAARLDLEFHVALAQATHNSVMVYLINGMRTLVQMWIDKALVVSENIKEHHAVLEAVFERDSQAAGEAMADHLTKAAERLLGALGDDVSTAEFLPTLLSSRRQGSK